MSNEATAPAPYRSLIALAIGFVVASIGWNLLPFGPADELPSLAAIPRTKPIEGWDPERGDQEFRVVAVGLSPTMGYPYPGGGAASFAVLCQAGLDAVGDAGRQPVRVAPLAMDSADAPTVVELCRMALEYQPDLLLVELGANEHSSRIVSGEPLVGSGWLDWIADRATRARLPIGEVGRRFKDAPEASDGASPWQQYIAKIFEARPGQPLVEGLPVGERDRAAIAERVGRAVDQIAELAAEANVNVVFWASPYDLQNAWPLGMVETDPWLDEAMLASRASGDLAAIDRGELDKRLDRADARHLLGRILLAEGRPDEARKHFERARDLDPAPLHITGSILEAIERGAERHEHTAFVDLAGSIDASFVDVTHPDLDGQIELARRLRELLVERGALVLDEEKRGAFDRGVTTFTDQRLPERQRRMAEGQGARLDTLTHMILGAVRDALPRMGEALVTFRLGVAGPADPDWQYWVTTALLAAAAVADDVDSLVAGTDQERATRLAEWSLKLWQADAAEIDRLLLEQAMR